MELLHVTTHGGWEAVKAEGGLGAEPFVHLCTEEQLAFVLERHFPEAAKLVLLRIEADGLDIRWEHSEPGMDDFPHLYGTAPLSAIRSAEDI